MCSFKNDFLIARVIQGRKDFPATVFKCFSFVQGVKTVRIAQIQSGAHPGRWITASTGHFPSMQPESSQAPLCPPPLQVRCPSHHDATLLCWAREHLPEGDFTTPITLTTAQTKPCHLNHKQQCSRTRERSPAGVTEQEGEKEMGGGCCERGPWPQTIKIQSSELWLGKHTETAQQEGRAGTQRTGFEPSTTAYWGLHTGKVTLLHPVSLFEGWNNNRTLLVRLL